MRTKAAGILTPLFNGDERMKEKELDEWWALLDKKHKQEAFELMER